MFTPTDEQLKIADAVKNGGNNFGLVAGPGCAKTSTIKWLVNNHLPKKARVLYLSFSKALADAAAVELPNNCVAMTVNSLGYALMRQEYGYGISDQPDDKTRQKYGYALYQKLSNYLSPKTKAFWTQKEELTKLFNFARYDISNFTEDSLREVAYNHSLDFSSIAQAILPELLNVGIETATRGSYSKQKQYWDFTDTLYIPYLQKITPRKDMILGPKAKNQFWDRGFDFIFVDEFQDFNQLQVEILLQIYGNAKLIVVGDPMQAIFEFMGSMPGIMESTIERINAEKLYLSRVFRCPSNVIDFVNQKFATNLTSEKEPSEIIQTSWMNTLENLTPETAVLVRNFRGKTSAYQFINAALRNGIQLNIKGLELWKIFNRVFKLVNDAAEENKRDLEWKDLPNALRELVVTAPKHAQAELSEHVGLMNLFLEISGATSPYNFQQFIKNYEETKSNGVPVLTGHASKGLEFHNVLVLDNHRMPRITKFQSPRQKQAEIYLYYVMLTRTLGNLRKKLNNLLCKN